MPVATRTGVELQSRLHNDLRVALPPSDLLLTQDEEWCVVRLNGKWREIRLHDYDEIFAVPGLYERLIYDILKCDSPARVRKLLENELPTTASPASRLRALDLGAGNGMVGEELASMGVEFTVGADISEAASEATERDRPGVYAGYHVVDMTRLDEDEGSELARYDFNCLTCVAALGFGDIPPAAFANAFNLIESDGWVAFNIKSGYLNDNDRSGFAKLVRTMISDDTLEVRKTEMYRHRVGTNRKPIEYTAVVGRKRHDIPAAMLS